MQFKVRVFDPSTQQVREDLLEASTRETLDGHVSAQGLVLLSVQKHKAASRNPTGKVPTRLPNKLDVAWWCQELRTLLTAGMTVVEAIETLNAQSLGHTRAQVHANLVDLLRQGQPLSVAMQTQQCFPSVLIAGIKASERTSSLVEALDDYLRYHAMLDQLRKQVVSAAIYPAVVVTLGGAITLFLLLFVIPRFSKMYSDLHGPMSWTTQVLIGASHLLNEHWLSVVLAVLTLVASAAWAWTNGTIQQLAQHAFDRFEPLQRQVDQFRLAKLYHSLALMFRGGYALDDALRQCEGLELGVRLSHGITRAQTGLAQGQRVSKAFGDAGLTDTVTQRLLAVGERTGNFDRVLQTIAERHASQFSTFVERATRVVEPVLLMTVALAVGGIVVMMYMPVFDIASSIH